MVTVDFKDDGLEIDLHGIEKLEAVKSRVFVPYANIDSVDDSVGDLRVGFKVAGAGLGQNWDFGRFETSDGYGFFAMRNRSEAFVIHLSNFAYKIIVLDLDNREEVIGEIKSRISQNTF